jgi:5,6,7,8-tetrahydromethanopterin hydro-lyase
VRFTRRIRIIECFKAPGIANLWVWLDPSVTEVDEVDHKALFDVHREATSRVIGKAMRGEPTIDWLLANQDKVQHYFHELGLKGEL